MMELVGNLRDISHAHNQLGNIAVCQHRWEEAIYSYQKSLEGYKSIGNPSWIAWAHLLLGRDYLKKGNYRQALQSFEEAADVAITLPQANLLSNALGGMEESYMALSTPEKFAVCCHSFKERHADVVEKLSLHQWYLESAEPSKEFPHLIFAADFDTEAIEPSWNWIDEFGDCKHRIVDTGGLEIRAANGRDLDGLNLSAPRLMREISGDFAVEVCVSSASDNELATHSTEKPQMGGLLVWRDRDNFLRFEKGVHGHREMRLEGYVDGKWQVAGRGLLSGDADEGFHLRLERAGEQFSAYCSLDEENWLTCGQLTLSVDDPIQIGIHAIGMIDRTIYCGSFKEGTATLFRGFQVWTR